MKQETTTPSQDETTTPLTPSTLPELLRIPPQLLHRIDIGRMNLICSIGLPDVRALDLRQPLQTLDIWAKHVSMRTESLRFLLDEHGDELENSEPLWRMYCLTRVLWREKKCRTVKKRKIETPMPTGVIQVAI